MSNHYIKNIIKRLGQNYKEDWVYAGGDEGRHRNYFEIFKQDKEVEKPPGAGKCCCGHDIVENCYVWNEKTKKIEVLGNCCIKKYLNKSGRTCSKCGEPHRNRKDNFCNKCRKNLCKKCLCEIDSKYKYCYDCYLGSMK